MHLLDDALRLSIFERLSARDLASVSGVSREWRRLGRDEHLWRALVAASPPALVPRCETSSSRHLFVLNEAWRLGRFRRLGRWRAPATRVFDLAFRPPPPRPRATTRGDDGPRPRGGAALALILDGVVRHVDLPPSPPPTDSPPLEPRSVRLEDRSPAGVDRTTRAAFLDPPRTRAAAGTSRGELFVCPAADAPPRRVATMGGAVTALAAAPEHSLGASVHSLLAVATSAPEANVLSILRVYEDDDADDEDEDEDEDEDAPSDVVSSRRRPSERSLEPSRSFGGRGRSGRSSPPAPRPRAERAGWRATPDVVTAACFAPDGDGAASEEEASSGFQTRLTTSAAARRFLVGTSRGGVSYVSAGGDARGGRPEFVGSRVGACACPVRAVAHVPSTRLSFASFDHALEGTGHARGCLAFDARVDGARVATLDVRGGGAGPRGGSWSSRRASPCALHADASKVVCVADGHFVAFETRTWTPASRGELFFGRDRTLAAETVAAAARAGTLAAASGGGEIVAVEAGWA